MKYTNHKMKTNQNQPLKNECCPSCGKSCNTTRRNFTTGEIRCGECGLALGHMDIGFFQNPLTLNPYEEETLLVHREHI